MPTITPEQAERVKQIHIKIVTLWNETEDAIDIVHATAHKAIITAWSVGKLLIEAKSILGHGNFGVWLERSQIVQQTANNYMKLAQNYQTISDLPENKRQAYLDIGILPPKDSVNRLGNTHIGSTDHWMTVFNFWSKWHSKVEKKKIDFVVDEQVKTRFLPMYKWLKEQVYGEN